MCSSGGSCFTDPLADPKEAGVCAYSLLDDGKGVGNCWAEELDAALPLFSASSWVRFAGTTPDAMSEACIAWYACPPRRVLGFVRGFFARET